MPPGRADAPYPQYYQGGRCHPDDGRMALNANVRRHPNPSKTKADNKAQRPACMAQSRKEQAGLSTPLQERAVGLERGRIQVVVGGTNCQETRSWFCTKQAPTEGKTTDLERRQSHKKRLRCHQGQLHIHIHYTYVRYVYIRYTSSVLAYSTVEHFY